MRSFSILGLLAILACGTATESNNPPPIPPAYAIGVISADTIAIVHNQVPVIVEVTDENTNLPVGGVLVNFVIVKGNGSVFAGSAITDTLGRAREIWTVGTVADSNTLEARAVDAGTGLPVVFARAKLLAVADVITRIAADTTPVRLFVGDTADIGNRVLGAFDQYNNLVDTFTTTWTIPAPWVHSGTKLIAGGADSSRATVHVNGNFPTSFSISAVPGYLSAYTYDVTFSCHFYTAGTVNYTAVTDSVIYPGSPSYRPGGGGAANIWFTRTGDDGMVQLKMQNVYKIYPDSVEFGAQNAANLPLGIGVRNGNTITGGDWCGGDQTYDTFTPGVMVGR